MSIRWTSGKKMGQWCILQVPPRTQEKGNARRLQVSPWRFLLRNELLEIVGQFLHMPLTLARIFWQT